MTNYQFATLIFHIWMVGSMIKGGGTGLIMVFVAIIQYISLLELKGLNAKS